MRKAADSGEDTGTAADSGEDTGTAAGLGEDTRMAADSGKDTGMASDLPADEDGKTAVDSGEDAGMEVFVQWCWCGLQIILYHRLGHWFRLCSMHGLKLGLVRLFVI